MTKTVGTWILFFTLCLSNGFGQTSSFTKGKITNSKNLYRENMFIHYNAPVLLTGEYLYYSIYSINAKMKELSTFSKIGYVELIGEDTNVIFKHKIKLTDGLGQGEFFIPVTVSSGSYKLIGYTQWMKNSGKNYFFQADIGIINPFKNNQESILKHIEIAQINTGPDSNIPDVIGVRENTPPLSLKPNKKIFQKRNLAHLNINVHEKNMIQGNYSISIRKMDSIEGPLTLNAQEYIISQDKENIGDKKTLSGQMYLPELRGELISGKIIPKEANFPLIEEKLALSIPGEQFVLKLSRTDKKGAFYFNLNQEYKNSHASIQILGKNKNNYRIQLNKQSAVNYDDLIFKTFTITPKMKNLILERSVYNQVENAFAEMKPDTIQYKDAIVPIYRKFSNVYNLDDYTRFSTIRETVSEIIEHVWVQRSTDGEDVFQVRGDEDTTDSNFLPLVTVDGMLIQNHGDVIDFNARKLKKISISRSECVINSITYKGVIAIETIEGDFFEGFKKDYITTIELFPPLTAKKYFHQEYNAETKSTTQQIPDFRQQLLWLPQLILESDKTKIDFFTSDVAGKYEICLEGFTSKGNPISVKETFMVE
nr:hypothetical protein [uncultured Allomuricauda sp.]